MSLGGAPLSDAVAPSPPSEPQRVLRSIGANALARVIMLPISAILGIVVTRLIIENYGEVSYAQYALIIGIGALLPFADLGMAAAIMNATGEARDARTDDHLRLTLVGCLRVLSMSATTVITLSVVIWTLGWWPKILGSGLNAESGALAASLCLALVGATLVFSVGERILAGLGKYWVYVILSGLQTPIVLLVLLAIIWLGVGGGDYIAVAGYAATLLLALTAVGVAARMVAPMLSRVLRDVWHVRTIKGAPILDTAWPTVVQMVALPIAMQTDRIILSHVSTVDELAAYSLASQMYGPIMLVVATAGIALWPVFAQARARGTTGGAVTPGRMSLLFGAVAVLLVIAVSLIAEPLAQLASGGRITLSGLLVLSFCVLVVLQAVKYPYGMYLTAPPGLRFQAYMVLLMLPVNLGLSWVLAERIGAPGPVIGSAVGVLLFQVLANWLYVRRQLRRTSDSAPKVPA